MGDDTGPMAAGESSGFIHRTVGVTAVDQDIFAGQTSATRKRSRMLLVLFMITMLLPFSFEIASLNLTPFRLLLLVVFIPYALKVLSGKAGRLIAADILMFLFGFWIFLSMLAVHGPQEIPYAGITAVELVGGYLLGRVTIRSANDHEAFFKTFLTILIFLFPFALVELFTSKMLIAELFEKILPTFKKNYDVRMGMSRVQVVFPHSILWGLFCCICIGNLFYIYGRNFMGGLIRAGFALMLTFFSLSSGPFLAGLLQVLLIVWDKISKSNWKLLTGLGTVFYVVIDALSNRSPLMIFIEEFTFSSGTAWTRVHIWNYGTDEVWRHPVFGIGLNDWVRPGWLTHSVDNFWLLIAMRYGLPAITFLLAAIALIVFAILRLKTDDDRIKKYRTGYLVTMAGLFMTLSTVHAWGAISVLVMFYIGMGSWFSTAPIETSASPPADAEGARPAWRYSRPPRAKPAPQEARPAKPGPRYTRPKGSRPTYSRERE